MQVALDEGPGPPIKHQYPDLCKLHHVVSQLIRCSDVTSKCKSSEEGAAILPNPYGDPTIPVENRLPLSKEAIDCLFNKTSYVKKLLEDVHAGEEGLKLLQFCSWENPQFTRILLMELLWQCGFAYWMDMRHHTDMLLSILLMEDSWQMHRIHNAVLGMNQEREGLLEAIQRTKAHYQKRAYQIMKCLVQLFKRSQSAHEILISSSKGTELWMSACEWLREELDRRTSNQYSYSSWAHPSVASVSTVTNENTNGYMLERSLSAKNTLQFACELLPGDVSIYETHLCAVIKQIFDYLQPDESFQIDSSDGDELPDDGYNATKRRKNKYAKFRRPDGTEPENADQGDVYCRFFNSIKKKDGKPGKFRGTEGDGDNENTDPDSQADAYREDISDEDENDDDGINAVEENFVSLKPTSTTNNLMLSTNNVCT